MIKFILLALLVLVGHLGWWIFCYNRINATSLPRQLIKRMERLIIVLISLIPIAMVIGHWSALQGMIRGDETIDAPLLTLWTVWSIGSVLVLGPGWLESRMWLWPPKNLEALHTESVDVSQQVSAPVAGTRLSRFLSGVPLNEITHLSVTRKTLRLEREFPHRWQSLSIAHLSDLHFTGDLTPDYYHYVVERVQALAPDLIVISGDIIDTDECLDWIDSIIGRLSAPLGCYFLFGNHERRLARPELVAERLTSMGWCDLGVHDAAVEPSDIAPTMTGRPRMILCGNERPWFERHVGDHWQSGPLAADSADECLKIAVAHTPDQHRWARELGMDLMLAGHTHGGQVRVPLLGPLVAPSRFGSRFASGVFRLPPTLMHVSRGLSGTQPLRWRCAPEVSLLTILPVTSASQRPEESLIAEPQSEPSVVT